MRTLHRRLAAFAIALGTSAPLALKAQWGQPRIRNTVLHPRTFKLATSYGRFVRPERNYEYGGFSAQYSVQRTNRILVAG